MGNSEILSADFLAGGGETLDIQSLLMDLKIGSGSERIVPMLKRRVAAAEARNRGISVTDEELAEGVSAFYSRRGLMESEQVNAWLEYYRIDTDQLKAYVETELLSRKLMNVLAPSEVITKRFQASMHDYARATLNDIRFSAEGAASEILLSLREGEMSWAEAKDRADDFNDSYEIRRSDAEEETAPIIFSSEPGSFVGPAETAEGDYAVYHIIARHDPLLDETLYRQIQQEIVNETLGVQFSRNPTKFLL